MSDIRPSECRKLLRRTGFMPIPVVGKIPPQTGWQKKFETNDAEIDLWAKLLPNAKSTGLLTRMMPTLDIDIRNPEAAAAVEDLVRERFEEAGKILVRFGNKPKRAIPFRTEVPFKKITVNLIAPDGDTEQKLELLADGQQVVGFGIHPGTRMPYDWFGGQPGEVKRDELPEISEAGARQIVEDAVGRLVRDHGYQRARARPEKQRRENGENAGVLSAAERLADWTILLENILAGRDLHDSTRDLAGKMITAGMADGAVVNMLRAMFEISTAPRVARWQARYDDIPRSVSTAREKCATPSASPATSPIADEPLRDLASNDVTDGKRAVTRLAGHLLRRYVDPHVALELLMAWNAARCSPPLASPEITTIVNWIAGRELKRRQAK